MRLVITGTGRCGTVYLAKLLTLSGIQCGHESFFTYKGFDKELLPDVGDVINSDCSVREGLPKVFVNPQADSSLYAAPYLSELKNLEVYHLVRHPLKVIKSFALDLKFFQKKFKFRRSVTEKFIYSHYPSVSLQVNSVDRAAAYYLECNRIIEKSCSQRYRLEYDLEELLSKIGLKFDLMPLQNNINSFSKRHKLAPDICLSNITSKDLRENLVKLASDYGYDL